LPNSLPDPLARLRTFNRPVGVLDTTYFLTASIVRAKGSDQSGIATVRVDSRHALSIGW
jgi:hypothetical protein